MNFLGKELDLNQATGYIIPVNEYKDYDVSYLKALQYAVDENTFSGLTVNKYTDLANNFKPSETYNEDVANKIIDEQYKDIRPEYRKNLIRDSKSEEELAYNAKYATERSLNRNYLESLGFATTIATDMASSLVDIPIIMGVSMISPFTGVALGASKARAFATGATLSYAFDTLQDKYGAREISELEKALGVAFTGSVNMALTNTYKNVKSEIFNGAMKEHLGITRDVEQALSKATTKEEKDSIIQSAYEARRTLDIESGNKERSIKDIVSEAIDRRYESGTISKGTWSKLRTDMEYLTKTSKSSAFKKFADSSFIDDTLQNNNLNSTTLFGLKDAYESIGKNIIATNTLKLDRMFSSMKKKTFTDHFMPRWLDNSQVYMSDILGELQGLRNNKLLTSEDGLRNHAIERFREFGIEGDNAIKLADESIKSIKKISKEFGELNVRFKDSEFNPDMVSDDYMPNIYTFTGGQKLIDKGFTKQEMEDYWYGSINSFIDKQHRDKGIERLISTDQERALREVARNLNEFLGFKRGVPAGLENDSSRLFKLALESANLTKKEREELSKILTGSKTGSNYMIKRMPIDRSFIHNVPNKGKISIMNYISHDIHEAFAKYSREQSGKIAGQNFKINRSYVKEDGTEAVEQLNLGTWEGVQVLRAKIAEELDDIRKYAPERLKELDRRLASGEIDKKTYKKLVDEQTLTDKEYKDELMRFDYMTYSLHGKPTAGLGMQRAEDGTLLSVTDGASNLSKVQQTMLALNSFRLLGATPFTMVSELHNVAKYSGVAGMMNGIKMIPDLMRFYTSGEFKNEALKEAGNILGFQSDFLHSLRPSMYDEDFSTSIYRSQKDSIDRAIDSGMSVSEKLAQFTLHTGGMIPFQTMLQAGMYSGFIKRLEDIASTNGARGFEKQIIKESGLSEDVAIRIGNLIRNNRNPKNGTIGFDNWDEESRMLFTIATKRLMDNVVQKPTIGGKIGLTFNDKLIASSVTGKFALELKQYMYQSYVKQFGKMVESKSAHHYLSMLSQAGMIYAFMFPEIFIKSGGNASYIEEKMKPENMLHETVSRMTNMGLPMMFAGAGSRATLGENIFSPYAGYDRRPLNGFLNSMPSADLVNTTAMIIPDTFKAIFGEEEDSSKSLFKDMRKLNTNILPMQFINNYIEGELYGK